MQGTISAINRERHSGHIQGDDGALMYFDESAFLKDEDKGDLAVGMRVSYNAIQDRALDLELLDKEEFLRTEALYIEPQDFELKKGPFKEGYEIISRGKYPLEAVDRDVDKARSKLIEALKDVGANVGLNLTDTQETRNAMGYGFIFHHLKAYPAVCAIRASNGQERLGDLEKRLNHKKIKQIGVKRQNEIIRKLVFKILCGILLVIFALGFIFTL